jgi:hypothetical protein
MEVHFLILYSSSEDISIYEESSSSDANAPTEADLSNYSAKCWEAILRFMLGHAPKPSATIVNLMKNTSLMIE